MSYSDEDPPGFWLYRRTAGYGQSGALYVPFHLKEPLIADDERRRKEEVAEREAKALADINKEEDRSRTNSAKRDAGIQSLFDEKKKSKAEEALEKEESVWLEIDAKDAKSRKSISFAVFRRDQALALFKSFGSGDSDSKERLKLIYEELVQRGTTRRLLGRPKSLRPLEELATKQPHMKEVVAYVMDQIKLAWHSHKPLRLQPMLLVGEAGVGKTHFAQSLAKALATSIHIQPLDTDLTSSFLLGSDRKWSNSEHGMLFEQVVLGQHANPVIVLDEIDKSHRGLTYGSPLASLHSVLEPVSATAVRDISLLFQFDVSQVTWIATANNVVQMDAPLRSRFKEFHIMPPDAQGCLVLAEEVMRAAIDSVGIQGFSTDVSLRRHMAHLPARQIWQLTREAMGKAVTNNRKHLVSEDLPEWLFEQTHLANSTPNNRMH